MKKAAAETYLRRNHTASATDSRIPSAPPAPCDTDPGGTTDCGSTEPLSKPCPPANDPPASASAG